MLSNTELLNQLLQLTIWKEIDGYENYQVSICGKVRNITTNKIKKPEISHKGYYRIDLLNNNKRTKHYIHRLVCKAFIPRIYETDIYVDHIDGDRLNNTFSNLRWCTNTQNCYNRIISNRNTSGV